ncbi:uncharacterized protein EDB91DRAFT_1134902 [Suillus paluster]|uniref:uncharacterized protein n=1 Tax=Suillus paluster TaxID=48578 RepID=UPI001B86A24A|nr:uncharacterized protein EDB91DRAFT_1134902 [Suillus paluster]KAG1739391.1 hypothetical protein EDB91DRAFT_1134902 [Suillus paluster]
MALKLLALSSLAVLANAHMAAFHKSMYCLNGTVAGQVNYNNDDPVSPLWMLKKSDYWFHHFNQCDDFPPAEGDFLELPAGGSFTVEIAANRGVTSLSYNGQYATEWGDGGNHPEDYSITNLDGAPLSDSDCISNPNMHTQNQSMAAGSAFAISYQSDISQVTMDNLAVFTVRYNTPWKRVTSYDVPKDMPACPAAGCTCAWVWIPNGCGEPNIYMQGFKCMVTGATSTTPIATPKAPVWCQEDQSTCTEGAKQILIWNQAEENNIVVNGTDLSGSNKSPAYNSNCGFNDGAQNDIFATSSSAMATSSPTVSAALAPAVSSSMPAISFSTLAIPSSAPAISSSTSAISFSTLAIPSSAPAFSFSTLAIPSSAPALSLPVTFSGAPSVASIPSCTTTTNTVLITSTVQPPAGASTPISSVASAMSSSNSADDLVASTSLSASAIPTSAGTCRRKRMVHKPLHRRLF